MTKQPIEHNRSGLDATFDSPYIVGAVGDVVQPGEEEAYFRVARQAGIAHGDEIVISLATDDGTFQEVLHASVGDRDWVVSYHVSPEWITRNDKRHVTASYLVQGKGESAPYEFQIGDAALRPPIIEGAVAEQLDPFSVPASGLVVRPPPGVSWRSTDKGYLVLSDGTDRYTTPRQPGSPNMAFTVPPRDLASWLGKAVQFTYVRERDGHQQVSESSTVFVLAIGDADARVPLPEVDRAVDGVLDLAAFTGDPVFLVRPWPLIAEGQRVWLRVHGEGTIVVADGVLTTAADTVDGLAHRIERSKVEEMAAGTELRLEYVIDLTGDNRQPSLSREATLVLQRAPKFLSETFESVPIGDVDGRETAVGYFSGWDSPAHAQIAEGQTFGAITGRRMTLRGNSAIALTCEKKSVEVSFDYHLASGTGLLRVFYRPGNTGRDYTLRSTSTGSQRFRVSDRGYRIAQVNFFTVSGAPIDVDNVSLTF